MLEANFFSLALQGNGTAAAWGDDSAGQGDVPAGLTNVVAIAAGWLHSLALQANGTVAAWGFDDEDQTDVPAGLSTVVAIAAGAYHTLALQSNGTVVAWGDNSYGQTNVPPGLSNVVAIAAGGSFSLAVQANGAVVAWGDDTYGEIDVPAGLTNAIAISAGDSYGLALQANGTVMAWGEDFYGEANLPVGLTNAVAIAAGEEHDLAIVTDGSPFVTKQPASQTLSSNSTVQFTVTALGAPQLNYQSQKNGVNLTDGGNVSGSATATLTLSNVQTADMAGYSVIISNSINSVASSPATLTIIGPPVILLQPASLTVNDGANIQFAVTAVGNPSPAYQWWWNGTNQVGNNSSILTLTGVGRAQDGIYTVMVTNAAGGILSSNVVLLVRAPQQLGAPMLLPNGSLQLTSSDVGGGTLLPANLPNFEAQASTNLVNWLTLSNSLSLTNGMLLLQDNTRTNYPARYYRIIEH